MKKLMNAMTAIILLSTIASCGTQIGNPPRAVPSRLAVDSEALQTTVTASLMHILDGMNAGDYAYASEETRVSSNRYCQTLALNSGVDFAHSVTDSDLSWQIDSQIKVARAYTDRWNQSGRVLGCEGKEPKLQIQAADLVKGSVRFESQIEETFKRDLKLTSPDRTMTHSFSLYKSGTRVIELSTALANPKGDSEWQALLKDRITARVSLTASSPERLTALEFSPSDPLAFVIKLGSDRNWEKYSIVKGTYEASLPESDDTLKFTFDGVSWNRQGGCLPQSGVITLEVAHASKPIAVFNLDFNHGSQLSFLDQTTQRSLLLAPFGCVLKER